MRKLTFRSEHFADPELDAEADVPEHYEPPIPAGMALVNALTAGIGGQDLSGEPLELGEFMWTTYGGHAFEATRAGVRHDVILKLQDREAGTWTLTAEVRRKLLSWKKKSPVVGLDALMKVLVRWLESTPYITDVDEVDAKAEAD